jgi:putative tryptophan/tyrosine transport system substrate-binding protein
LVAKAATQTIPIVFVTAADPVAAGLVSSINRPGGNITGITFFGGMLGTKNLELVRTLMPSSDVIGFFYNPDNPSAIDIGELQAGAQSLGQQLILLPARSDADIEAEFALVADRKIRAILVAPDALFFARREQLVARAAKIDVAVISDTREFALAGALLSYGASVSDGFQKFGLYVARILKGEKPSERPACSTAYKI